MIIPTLNEAANLGETVARAREGAREIIVSDGGSRDGTPELATALGLRVLLREKAGRAAQMNAGAALATGEVLLFLHADTWLQPGALAVIEGAMRDSSVAGGGFERRFRSSSWWLAMTCRLAPLRNRMIGWHFGDQAQFCRAPLFRKLGGFAPMRAFEDVDLARRLRRRGRLVTLRPPVLSSARRFEQSSPVRRTFGDLWLVAKYLARPEQFAGEES